MVRRMSRSLFAGAVALAMLAGVSASALAQGATVVTGRVINKTGDPIQGASVLVDATNYGAITAADGRYTINVPASRTGAASVTARLIGYRALRQTVSLTGARINLDFSLQSAPTQLSEVIVTALSQQREKATLGTAQSDGVVGRPDAHADEQRHQRDVGQGVRPPDQPERTNGRHHAHRDPRRRLDPRPEPAAVHH